MHIAMIFRREYLISYNILLRITARYRYLYYGTYLRVYGKIAIVGRLQQRMSDDGLRARRPDCASGIRSRRRRAISCVLALVLVACVCWCCECAVDAAASAECGQTAKNKTGCVRRRDGCFSGGGGGSGVGVGGGVRRRRMPPRARARVSASTIARSQMLRTPRWRRS